LPPRFPFAAAVEKLSTAFWGRGPPHPHHFAKDRERVLQLFPT